MTGVSANLRRVSVLGCLVVQYFAVVRSAFTCSKECVRPPDAGYSYCAMVSKWSTCPLDKVSSGSVENFAKQEVQYAKARSATPLSADCLDILKTYYCFGNLPTCEAGRHSMQLCFSACDEVRKKCNRFYNDSTITRLCKRTHQTTESSCMDLDYSGPNYGSWVIGFSLCFVFSALSSYSFNLQKFSIDEAEKESKLTGVPPPPVHRQWRWLVGLFFLISGSIVDFVAYGLAPQSLLTPLAAMVLVWNILVAAHFGEKPGRREIMSTVVIVFGTVIAVIFADHYSPSYSYNDIVNLWIEPTMIVYVFLSGIVVSIHMYGIHYIQKHALYSPNTPNSLNWMRLECLCYGGCAGTLGGQAILFAKQFMELLKSWGAGEAIWSHFPTYIILICVPLFLVSNIRFMNGGLSHYGSLQMIPIYQTYWIIFGTASGLVYFKEYKELDSTSLFFFIFGCSIALFGIALLSGRDPQRKGTHGEKVSTNSHPNPMNGVGEGVENDDDTLLQSDSRKSSDSLANVYNSSPRFAIGDMIKENIVIPPGALNTGFEEIFVREGKKSGGHTVLPTAPPGRPGKHCSTENM